MEKLECFRLLSTTYSFLRNKFWNIQKKLLYQIKLYHIISNQIKSNLIISSEIKLIHIKLSKINNRRSRIIRTHIYRTTSVLSVVGDLLRYVPRGLGFTSLIYYLKKKDKIPYNELTLRNKNHIFSQSRPELNYSI